MSHRVGNCPNCGAPVEFLWSSSIQTVCPFCKSILVRTDVDLKRVGQVADLPADSSPIQIATEGVYRHKPFRVVGRIIYEYEQGTWNEWHVVFSDSTSGWLSDAQNDYAVSTLCANPGHLPAVDALRLGQTFLWAGTTFEITCLTRARYRGTEGELPFESWDKDEALFADLESTTGRFATIDYSDPEPVLYLGESVSFDDLQLKNLRRFEGW
jgi:hypothetical protein